MSRNQTTINKTTRLARATRGAWRTNLASLTALVLAGALLSAPADAQQAGSIKGKVLVGGQASSGVTVTASSNVMPQARTVTTNADGSYNLPLLVPGRYELTFTAADGTTRKAIAEVLLDQSTRVDVTLAVGDLEEVLVFAQAINQESNASVGNSIGAEVVEGVPTGENYRDLMKLIPGVQYSEYETRGPSAGGSGQHNNYNFDGVDTSLPLFGTLASEPSTQDVEMISVQRGGANAIGFNRSGGFTMDTKSKSGTNKFHGSVEYKLQTKDMVADKDDGLIEDTDKSWVTGSVSGPIIKDRLFFYGSYFRPEEERSNKETVYGPTKKFNSSRDEYFGKLTYAPTDDILLGMSYRTSERTDKGDEIDEFDADSVSAGSAADQDIWTFDGSWVVSGNTTVSFAASSWEQKSATRPDNVLSVQPEIGNSLDVNNLEQMGYFTVPFLLSNPVTPEEIGFNVGAQALIDEFGYVDGGTRRGGGHVGGYSINYNDNYYRDAFEVALDHEFEFASMSHSLHVGLRWEEGEEEIYRPSNGWGSITYRGGNDDDVPGAFYRATVQQQGLLDNGQQVTEPLNSYIESTNFEINDTIEYGDFTYSIGVLISEDAYFGEGLRRNSSNVSGFELADDPNEKYKMYTIDWKDMIQPRLGITWAYNGSDTVFANYAIYNPQVSSLARAASWGRFLAGRAINVYFDENGNYLSNSDVRASSGKLFASGLKPLEVEEFTLGTTKGVGDGLNLRAHVRYREGKHFWEDIWNYARSREGTYGPLGGVPEDLRALGDYVPAEIFDPSRDEIGGSSYVIAEVDGGFTKYWEANVEAEWVGERTYANVSLVRSHYTGNVDQDNTTTDNDQAIFVGSSNYNDDTGQYVWDNKRGTLKGDRPWVFKAFGYYTTAWNANLGAFLLYQSGEPWEKWSAAYYGLSSSDLIRYAEPAGSRRSPDHWQLDLNYTQNFRVYQDFELKFRADLFNVFDKQTGYDIEPYFSKDTFGEARHYFNPRRLQLSLGMDF